MKFIKQSSIDTVIEEARIYDVVASTEELKKQGAHYFCKSPFTQEKTASLCVNVIKNMFYDNSAGFGGNAITWIMKRHNKTFFEAIEHAASVCHIILEFEEQSEDARRIMEEKTAMEKLVAFAAEQYQKAFHKQPAEHWVQQMVRQQRYYNDETIQAFMIGFAPNERSYISTPAINMGMFDLAKTIGLTNTKDGGSYDFFRDRLMFPIHNANGVIIGFGGRISNEEGADKFAKYLNSKESKLYLKDKVLYGFWQAKKTIAATGKAVLVEGYTDVISLHQAGATNALAPCGTSLTEDQVRLLGRVCKTVIIFMDGDKAGLRAVFKDIDLLLAHGLNVLVAICPDGEDPDSLSRELNVNEFLEKTATDAVIWKAEQLKLAAINPELTDTKQSLQRAYEEQAEKLRADLVPAEAFKDKGINLADRKELKRQNDKILAEIREMERSKDNALKDIPKYDPTLLAESVEQMGNTLYKISNSVKQKEYVKIAAKILEQPTGILTQIIQEHEAQEEKERKNKSDQDNKKEHELLRLPEGADKDQYLEDLFCEIGNMYWFRDGDKSFFPGTNFRIQPLFHVEGKQDNKRLCEVVNTLNHKRLIDFDSTDLISYTKVQERLVQEGFFFFEPGSTVTHFRLMVKKLLRNFITATELKILGHQREGFFAFADGIFHQGNWHGVNKYGIINIEGLVKEKSEYRSDISHYYSPSHSEIYKAVREDDDPYENDRHFVYKVAPVSLDQWMAQMKLVFGEKGMIGAAFCLAANFRDLFLQHWKYFPLLGGFGQRDSGKSGFGNCIQAFFYYDLKALELNTSTLVGISRRLTRCKNTVVFFDEYRDDLDEAVKQQLKGVWNGIGREKGKGVESTKTSTDKINSALYFAGQYIPAGDDGALPSRMIALNFEQKEHSAEAKEEYAKLIAWNNVGLSSFVTSVLQHRDYVAQNLVPAFNETTKELKAALKGHEYQNRIFENALMPLVTVKLLHSKFHFPFTYEDYFELTKSTIIDNSDVVSDSDGLARFWRVVEYLANPEVKLIKEEHDYQIAKEPSFKIKVNREVIDWKNEHHDKILFLSFSKVHQEYQKEVTRRKDEDYISETVIRNYLKSKKYFIGLFPSRRMGSLTPSGYAFNYSMMQRMGILTLPSATDGVTQTEIDLHSPRKHQIITNPDQVQMTGL